MSWFSQTFDAVVAWVCHRLPIGYLPIVPNLMTRTDEEFRRELVHTSRALGFPPAWLTAIICFETAQTWDPTIRNRNTGALGLLQWREPAARYCGTTQAALVTMTAIEQLRYVRAFFEYFAPMIETVEQAYLLVLVGKFYTNPDPASVVWQESDPEYNRNKGLDHGMKGYITQADATSYVRSLIKAADGWIAVYDV